jgi:xylulokinase
MLLGLDIGTSSVKAILVDPQGVVRGVGSAAVPMHTPRPGWTEQEPGDWWDAAVSAVRGVLAMAPGAGGKVEAIGLSGQMHGSVFLDHVGVLSRGLGTRAVRPALLWNDQRTADELADIEAAAGGRAALVQAVGSRAMTGFQLPKILWLRRHEPEHFKRLAAVLLPKDFIRFRLSGELATDAGDASGTLLFDVVARRWRTDLMKSVGVDPSLFPLVVESGEVAGCLSAHAAETLGLPAGIPIAGGSGDNQCGAVGAGVVRPGMGLAILGTSGVVYAHADVPRPDVAGLGRTHAMAAATGQGGWCVTGVMLSAAGSVAWAADRLFPGVSLDTLLAEAWAAPAGAGGLVFGPYVQGERCPHPDPSARGALVGLSLAHTRGHVMRAVIEGVSFAMADILSLVRSLGVECSTIRLGGGGAKSPQWRQLLADLFGVPVEVPTTEEGGAYGAAILSAVAAGRYRSVPEACEAWIRVTDRTEPSGAISDDLKRSREAFARLYPAIKAVQGAGVGGAA